MRSNSLPLPAAAAYFFYNVGNACGGSSVRPIGTQFTPGVSVYIKSGINCFATPSSASYDYYTSGAAEIPATDFIESTTTTVTM